MLKNSEIFITEYVRLPQRYLIKVMRKVSSITLLMEKR